MACCSSTSEAKPAMALEAPEDVSGVPDCECSALRPPSPAGASDVSTELGSEPGSLREVEEEEADLVENASLFLVDWDDTLFPTTWLTSQELLSGRRKLQDGQRGQLDALAAAAAATLEAASRHGRVVIVTNAAEGWVQQSCLFFMPSLVPVLQRLSIVSARSTYEPRGVKCPTEWKCRAFAREVKSLATLLPEEARLSIVALGDSPHEHEAAVRAAAQLAGSCAKSLQFPGQPSLERLLDAHALVAGSLEDIVAYDGELDVDIATSI